MFYLLVDGQEYFKDDLEELERANWAEERLAKLSAKELEELSVRVLDAKSIATLVK